MNIDFDEYMRVCVNSAAEEIRKEEDKNVLKSLGVKIRKKCEHVTVTITGSGPNPTLWRKNCQNYVDDEETDCGQHRSVDLV